MKWRANPIHPLQKGRGSNPQTHNHQRVTCPYVSVGQIKPPARPQVLVLGSIPICLPIFDPQPRVATPRHNERKRFAPDFLRLAGPRRGSETPPARY